jgi:aerobic carbon-monoxide dehydrogenase medium subunit
MKPGRFTYHAPESLDAAFALLGEYGDDAKIIAGGQSLIPMMNLRLARPDHLVDINAISGLAGVSEDGDQIVIGSLTCHADIGSADILAERCPLLPAAAKFIGHHAIRNRGTIGGSLSHADPAAEWPLIAILLDAEMVVQSSRGERRVQAADFVQSIYTVDLEADEIVTSLIFPALTVGEGWAFQQICRRAGDFALVSVATTLSMAPSGTIKRLRICLGGMDVTPLRLGDVEKDAIGKLPDTAWIDEVAHSAAETGTPGSDMHASAEYRQEMAAHLTKQALNAAIHRCGRGDG